MMRRVMTSAVATLAIFGAATAQAQFDPMGGAQKNRLSGARLESSQLRLGVDGSAVGILTLAGDANSYCGLLVDFGDGSSENVKIEMGQGFPRLLRHGYSRPGVYEIRVRGEKVTTHYPCEGNASLRLEVIGQPRMAGIDREAPRNPMPPARASAPLAERAPNAADPIDELLRRANEGRISAMNELGLAYASGKGGKQSYTEAAKWYRQAAERNDAKGMFNLGFLLNQGYGAPQDYAEARRLYQAAADLGFAPAMSGLGRMYALGNGVAVDLIRAHAWFSLATALAEDDETRETAAQNRDKLAKALGKADLAKAQALAKKLQPAAGPK